MKKLFLNVFAFSAITLTACGNNHSSANTSSNQSMVAGTKSTVAAISATPSISIKEIISAYLQMKNAFTNDDTKAAAEAGKSLHTVLMNFDTKALSAQQAKTFNDIADDAKENAEHIGANAGNIKHQREHFVSLSKDMADLIKTFGNGGQILYKDFCPMANKGKGAIWFSEVKEIKNPYLGKEMPTCGSVKDTIH